MASLITGELKGKSVSQSWLAVQAFHGSNKETFRLTPQGLHNSRRNDCTIVSNVASLSLLNWSLRAEQPSTYRLPLRAAATARFFRRTCGRGGRQGGGAVKQQHSTEVAAGHSHDTGVRRC